MAHNAINFLTEKYNTLTGSERQLCDYIIKNLDDAIYLSIKLLAKNANVSVATIVRLAQHLGFSGYTDFRLYLAKIHTDKEDFILDFEKKSNDVISQIEKVLTASKNAIDQTLNELDFDTLKTISELIHNANSLVFVGTGTSSLPCEDISYKFNRVGKMTMTISSEEQASLWLPNLKENDVVFGVSHSGNSLKTCNIMKIAHELQLKTVAITTFPDSEIAKYSDYLLQTQTRESPLHKVAITSRISQFAIMDSLFMCYFSIYHNECIENLEKFLSTQKDLKILHK